MAKWRCVKCLPNLRYVPYPLMYKGNILPYILNTTGYGTYLNKFGKPFTHRHLTPEVEALALDTEWNKMLLSYALQKEINSQRCNKHGGVYYTISFNPEEIRDELYSDLPNLSKGIYKDIMEIFLNNNCVTCAPFAHYFEGGIKRSMKIWEPGFPDYLPQANVQEVVSGANRVSAATTEMLIEGNIAGDSAAKYSAEAGFEDVSDDILSKWKQS